MKQAHMWLHMRLQEERRWQPAEHLPADVLPQRPYYNI